MCTRVRASFGRVDHLEAEEKGTCLYFCPGCCLRDRLTILKKVARYYVVCECMAFKDPESFRESIEYCSGTLRLPTPISSKVVA